MNLSKEQARTVYALVEKEINMSNRGKVKLVKKTNLKLKQETLEKFKKTSEYAAIMLLNKSFPGIDIHWNIKQKEFIQHLADKFYKVKYQSEYLSAYDEFKNIQLLAIDCKNLQQLITAINQYYGFNVKLVNKINIV